MSYFFTQLDSRAKAAQVFTRIALIGLAVITGQTAIASEGHFNLGYEAQLYRPGILPDPFHIVSVGGDYEDSDENSSTKIDLKISFSPEKMKVWAARGKNLYWSPTPMVSLGRKERTWNELDTTWNLSFVQPIDQWDRFRPEQQGLTGVFLDLDLGFVEAHLFGSYFMYPENIPNVVIENGKFQPDHPQAISSTPETITLLNQSTPLYYMIDYPRISEVILRPSIMFDIETKSDNPLLLRLLYAYKPTNYFNFALTGNLSIPDNQVKIFIKPRLDSNQIIAGDLGYRSAASGFSIGASGLAQIPDQETLSSDYTYAPSTNAYLISPWVKFKSGDWETTASFLSWSGGLSADIGPYSSPGSAVFSSHIFYRNASQIKTSLSVPFLQEGSQVQAKWVHEFDLAADWLSGDIFIPIDGSIGKFKLTFGGDLIQSNANSNPALGGELLVDLRPLDHARLGVQIAF